MNFLIIGEHCVDIHILCEINRLCPEAPVPVLNPIGGTQTPGMAANVHKNILSLGEAAILITHASPIKKTRYIDKQSGYIVVRIDEDDRVEIKFSMDEVINQLRTLKYDGIIISDYNKGFLTEDNIYDISELARLLKIPSFLDTKKILDTYAKEITVVKINEKEFKANSHLERIEDYCQNLVVTLGARGCNWIGHNHTNESEPVQVSDVSGAGDSFLAAFAIKYVETKSIPEAMEYGNRAARIAVSRHGIVAVKKEEII